MKSLSIALTGCILVLFLLASGMSVRYLMDLDPWAVFLWAAFGVPPGDGSRIQRVFQCGNGVRGPLGVLISRSSGTER
jgi:hypothetical protein